MIQRQRDPLARETHDAQFQRHPVRRGVHHLGQDERRARRDIELMRWMNPDTSLPCPDDKVNRLFKADRPNKLWVSDFTYVPTWSGTVYVAFVIDVFARRIVGWRTSTSMKTQFVLDALEQAIWQRKTPDNKILVHHSDLGSQYLSIKYTERLAEAEIDLSVGTVGDAYDNALAECVIGLFKTEVINQIGPWKSMREVEW